MIHLRYSERASYCLSPLARHLFQLMDEKETNIALSADVVESAQLITLAEEMGPEICVLKTHIDILVDFTPSVVKKLRKIAEKNQFVIFEDRKFADIGNTVKLQYSQGIYHIVDWAEIVNAHCLPGPGIVKGLAEIGRKKNRGLVLIAEMSSEGHLLDQSYIKNTLDIAESHADFVIGFITQKAISDDPHWINFTPGVKLSGGKDNLGQRYITPAKAINENGSDILIIGRGIIAAKNPLQEARSYRQNAWECYVRRCNR